VSWYVLRGHTSAQVIKMETKKEIREAFNKQLNEIESLTDDQADELLSLLEYAFMLRKNT